MIEYDFKKMYMELIDKLEDLNAFIAFQAIRAEYPWPEHWSDDEKPAASPGQQGEAAGGAGTTE